MLLVLALQGWVVLFGLGPCFCLFQPESLSGERRGSCVVIFMVSISIVFCILAIISIWAVTKVSRRAILVSLHLDFDNPIEESAELPGEWCYANKRAFTWC